MEENLQLTDKKHINFNFKENKIFVYIIIFYSCGLAIGSYFYKLAQGEKIDSILAISDKSLIEIFSSNICVYMSVFLIAVFLGFCLIGYQILNLLPLAIGINCGLKISYYFLNFSAKGLSYSLLMIIPYEALFLTVISFTISTSATLSKSILNMTKAENSQIEFSAKEYLKKYLIYGLMIIATAFINAGLTKLLIGVVTI